MDFIFRVKKLASYLINSYFRVEIKYVVYGMMYMNKFIFIILLLSSNITGAINFTIKEDDKKVGAFDSSTEKVSMVIDVSESDFIGSVVPAVIKKVLAEAGDLDKLANSAYTPHTCPIKRQSIAIQSFQNTHFSGSITTVLNDTISIDGTVKMHFSIYIQDDYYTIQLTGTYTSSDSESTIVECSADSTTGI
ncbi:hypothetical protein [Endozoicomonas sp. Mp262]|uniref:hypothetical protein n=1 Tax=Endozoicomonas sp. Mp262 TaxID=2919499 RepID=UPI0021D89A7A